MDETDYENMAERQTKALGESMKQTIAEYMTLAWYDPTNKHVSTDKHDPLFTPLGQLWPLEVKREWVGLTDEEIKDIVGRNDSGEIVAATARIAALEAENEVFKNLFINEQENVLALEAENKRLREPMSEHVARRMIDEWDDAHETEYILIKRVEAWHREKK